MLLEEEDTKQESPRVETHPPPPPPAGSAPPRLPPPGPRLRSTNTMAPPPPMACPVPTCHHTTPEGLPSYKSIYNDLNLHTKYVHADPPPNREAPKQTQPKPKELPRPELDEEITESDWQHFLEKWNRYKKFCLNTTTALVTQDQLRACCSERL